MRAAVILNMCLLMSCGGGGGSGGGATNGGGGGGGTVDPRLDRVSMYEAQRLRVLGGPGSAVAGLAVSSDLIIPDSGTAVFNGAATLTVETAPHVAVLVGDAEMILDFAQGPLTGRMDGFFGVGSDGALRNYTGALQIEAGTIGAGTANAWGFDYGGALTAEGQTLALEGTVSGEFLGNPVAAIAGADFEPTITIDAAQIDGVLTIVAEVDS